MALGDNYITSALLKSYMGIEINTYDVQIADAISSASREIEDYCHRQFNDAGSVSARIFRPTGPCGVIVDDFSTITGLIIQSDDDGDGVFENTWAATDYELSPIDGIRNGQTGWPFWRIRATGAKRFTNSRRSNVKVTARWGWAAVPTPVIQSTYILASDTFQLKDSRLGVAGSDQFGQIVRVRDNQTAASKLRYYTRQKVYVA